MVWTTPEADARGFETGIEGVPEHLLAKYEALPPKAMLTRETIGGILLDASYPCNSANYTKCSDRRIDDVFIHYTGGVGSARANAAWYSDDPSAKASAHLFIGWASEGARVYQSVDFNDIAWGVIGWNSHSIHIEVACHNDSGDRTSESKGWYFDPETVAMLDQIVRALMARYGFGVDHVRRHFDGTGKICPAMWVHDEAAWDVFRARLVTDELHELAVSVCRKIGSKTPDFWEDVLKGTIDIDAGFVRELFRKVCISARKAYTEGTLYVVAKGILGLGADSGWAEIMSGAKKPTPAALVPLFGKIDKVLR